MCLQFLSGNSKSADANASLSHKLAEYIIESRPLLERAFDKFTSVRLKNSYEINCKSDFHLFLREPTNNASAVTTTPGKRFISFMLAVKSSVLCFGSMIILDCLGSNLLFLLSFEQFCVLLSLKSLVTSCDDEK